MIRSIESAITSRRPLTRVAAVYPLFLGVFFLVTTLSYFLLPEGILRGRHPLHNWETSPDVFIAALQIFSFNLLSVAALTLANLFAERRGADRPYLPVGYVGLFTLIVINGLVLGTWSFEVISEPVPLLGRFLRTFDLLHRAGLWEMSGQLLITCATAGIALVLRDGKTVVTRRWGEIRLSAAEIAFAVGGLLLMLTGAFIESAAILAAA